jgi:hypothetical protein
MQHKCATTSALRVGQILTGFYPGQLAPLPPIGAPVDLLSTTGNHGLAVVIAHNKGLNTYDTHTTSVDAEDVPNLHHINRTTGLPLPA